VDDAMADRAEIERDALAALLRWQSNRLNGICDFHPAPAQSAKCRVERKQLCALRFALCAFSPHSAFLTPHAFGKTSHAAFLTPHAFGKTPHFPLTQFLHPLFDRRQLRFELGVGKLTQGTLHFALGSALLR